MEKAIILAADFIAEFEGFSPVVYKCPGGHNTFGYGSLVSNYGSVKFPVTKEQAKVYLMKDIMSSFKTLDALVDAPLNINQTVALASFIYNVGSGNFGRSTLRKELNKLNFDKAANELLKWTKAGGKDLPGLVRRREAERKLFLTPVAGK